MEEAGNSGIENAVEESASKDRLEVSAEVIYNGSSDTEYEAGKSEEKPTAKKSGKINGLEKAVSESKAKSNKVKVDDAEQLTKLPQSLAEHIDIVYRYASEEDEDTPNGAVAIIYHKNKKTGNLEFLFEEKPVDYPVPEASGKLSFVGGRIKTGENSLEALVRELTEEIEEPAATIVLKSLRKNDNPYRRLPYEYKGITGYTDIYVIHVGQENDWNAVKWTAFRHDAGFPKVLTHNDVIERSKDFAFGYGEIAGEFVKNNLKSNESKFMPFLYADSINRASHFVFSEIRAYSLNL